MTLPLERAARAAYEKRRTNSPLPPRLGHWATWEELDPASRDHEIAVFAAGLRAIREAGGEGSHVGDLIAVEYVDFEEDGRVIVRAGVAAAVFTAMIDHILGEGE